MCVQTTGAASDMRGVPSVVQKRMGAPQSTASRRIVVGAENTVTSVEELAAEAGDDDGESFVEFGDAVVAGQDGGQGAQARELRDG